VHPHTSPSSPPAEKQGHNEDNSVALSHTAEGNGKSFVSKEANTVELTK